MRSGPEHPYGFGRGKLLMATQSWDYVDPYSGRTCHVKAGITFAAKNSVAFQSRPVATAWAA
jgi:hypothetical protein